MTAAVLHNEAQPLDALLKVAFKAYLLLVFPLGVKARLDAFPGLLEGLPLGALCRVMGAHSNNVGAGENQNVGHYLWKKDKNVGGHL